MYNKVYIYDTFGSGSTIVTLNVATFFPSTNIMLKTTAESIPYNLKQIGYKTHAIHNHRGVFYGRNRVFPNLGYDTFTSVEYMNNVGRTPKNWAKDKIGRAHV